MQNEDSGKNTDVKQPQLQIPWQHRWVTRFYEQLFDPPIRLLSRGFSSFATIEQMMKHEANYWTEKDRKQMKYILQLMQYLYSRASTLLTHISVMVAMFTVIATQSHGLYFFFIILGIFMYLIIAIALIRCLRDIGLDKTYVNQDDYEKETLKELGFRFSLIRFSNVAAIVVTIVFIIGSFLDFIVESLEKMAAVREIL